MLISAVITRRRSRLISTDSRLRPVARGGYASDRERKEKAGY